MLGILVVFLIALRSCLRRSNLREEQFIAVPGSWHGPAPIHSVRGLHLDGSGSGERGAQPAFSFPVFVLSMGWSTHVQCRPSPQFMIPRKSLVDIAVMGVPRSKEKWSAHQASTLHWALSPALLLLLVLKQSPIKFWKEALNLWSSCFSLLDSWPFATSPRRFSVSHTLLSY